jgi:hypothetical protein
MTTATYRILSRHLLRADGQEDLTFALWRPSAGRSRQTALLTEVLLPRPGERTVHGNVGFGPPFLERAFDEALEAGAGISFLHSHPGGRGWQGMSGDDVAAEEGIAAQVLAVTGLPLVGLTMAGDGSLGARFWHRVSPRRFERGSCESVRVVGDHLIVTYDPELRPVPPVRPSLERTVSAWGDAAQADLARLRVGIVGAGNVGQIVAEALARTGVQHLRLIDFDSVKTVNLDRLLHSDERDVALARSKVEGLARRLRRSARAAQPSIEALELSVVEPDGYKAAIDCDVLFSCVDRPWPRAVLNFLAYAHLIPVIDGGIVARTKADRSMRGAEWRAHIAAPGRRCLECLGQYDPGLVQAEREGYFDDPTYVAGLPRDHPVRRNENVFAFGLADASLEVLQLVSMSVAPSGVADVGAQTYHLSTGWVDRDERACEAGCVYAATPLLAAGDTAPFVVTGRHEAATRERSDRRHRRSRFRLRTLRAISRVGDAFGRLFDRVARWAPDT